MRHVGLSASAELLVVIGTIQIQIHYPKQFTATNVRALFRLNSGNSTQCTRTTLFPSRWTLFK